MSKVALYARVSKDDNIQTNENQLIRLREAAAARSHEVVAEYTDRRSGADPNRPGLDAMMADARRGHYDLIMIVRLDRIARSMVNLAALIEDLNAANVGITCLDQAIDTSTASGRLVTQVLGAVAEFERELIRDRTNDGLRRARAEGKTLGRPASQLTPYQIDKARRILESTPGISKNKLAAEFEGVSRNTLIKQLREAGIL